MLKSRVLKQASATATGQYGIVDLLHDYIVHVTPLRQT